MERMLIRCDRFDADGDGFVDEVEMRRASG